jgi:hypothetical protein
MNTLEVYENIIALCPRIERKGKTVPYTSANGHMFSFINKDNELGFKFSKEVQEKYLNKFDTSLFKSHNSIMKGYILIKDDMYNNTNLLVDLLNESYDYVMSLKSK